MTEASICEASNSDCELFKASTRELTPDNDSDGKHSQSSDSPADTTGGDENTSRTDDTVCCQENERPSPSTVENSKNKFIISLRQKDEEIKRLADENKNLRVVLAEKTNKYDVRVQELVEELERHAELVERLQAQLTEAEMQIRQKHQHLANLRQQLNNQRKQLQQHQQNHSGTSNSYHQQTPATEIQKVNNRIGGTRNEDIAFLGELLAAGGPTNSDEVCAALNAFIEKNRNADGEHFTLNPNDLCTTCLDEELAQPIMEYLNKMIMDSSTMTSNQVESAFAMLLDAAAMENNNGNGNGANNNSDYANEKESAAGLRSPNVKSAQKSGATVREYVNGTRSGGGEQHFYRGAAGISAASSTNTGLSINGGIAKMKFSQHVTSSSPASTTSSTNVLARPSTLSHTTQFSSSAPQRTLIAYSTPSASGSASATTTTPSSSTSNAKPLTEEEQRTIAEMQERVAANVARLGSRPLNTLEIAKQCKRLMLSYNIGQRLFAKAVMCQVVKSQGSLSELLSKPRSWHKLTDKGREAFRRIYGWLSDDVAIELLCTLSPRRVAMPCDRIEHPTPDSLLDNGETDGFVEEHTTNLLNGGGGFEDTLSSLLFSDGNCGDFKAEESKTSSNIVTTKGFSSPDTSISSSPPANHQYFNARPASTNGVVSPAVSAISTASSAIGTTRTINVPLAANNTSNGSRWRHDDIPREKIIGIFEAEKAKLREQVKQCVDDNLVSNGVPLLSGGASGDSTPASPNASSVHSLVTVSLSSSSGRLKVEPAPILQEQFEKYPLLDTEDVVKQVKDYLSRHSVSQRQFGETVLGLSQGSVSDLLARPKSWSSLTHKGREPFIRMKIFLDEHANDERPPASLNNNNNGNGMSDGSYENANGTLEKIDGLNFGMEEECRDTPEPDILFKTLLEQVKAETPDAHQEEVPGAFVLAAPPQAQEKEEKNSTQDFTASLAAVAHQQTTKTEPEEYPLDTADLCKRIKEFLSKNGISQRYFGEHVMSGMSSGSVSDLLSRPKTWPALSPKAREQYTRMSQFLHDDRAKVALRLNATNASINSVARNCTSDIVTVRDLLSTKASSASNFVLRQSGNGAASATAEFITSPLPVTAFSETASRQSANFASGAAPKFSRLVVSQPNYPQQQMRQQPLHQQQQQHQQMCSPTASAVNLNFSLAPKRKAPSECSSSAEYNQDVAGAPSGKKIPRFQRTIITDAQKEALLFVYAEQQRPSAKTIDLLSIRLGLSSRTVTNWFHNYRTRQKAKEQKLTNEARDNGLPPPVLKPNPLQVADPTTKTWYKDLCEILAQNCSPHNNNNGANENNNSSLFNESDGYASFLDMTGDDAGGYAGDNCSSVNDRLLLDSDFIHQNGHQEGSISDYGGIGVGVEMEDDEEAELRMMTPKSGCSSTEAGTTASNANDGNASSGVTALDRVIARMHDRLAATTSGDNA